MAHIRQELIKVLDTLRPALADKPLIPVFTCFCFTGSMVVAYNDALGIVAPFKVDTPFAVHGMTLLGMLKNSRAKEVVFAFEGDNLEEGHVLVTASRSRIKLPYFKLEEFLFVEPEEKWQVTFPLTKAVVSGLGVCLTTASKDFAQPSLLGITVKRVGKDTNLFSCDGDAISQFDVGDTGKGGDFDYVLPSSFCDSILRIAGKEEVKGTLFISEDWACAQLGGYKIYGRIMNASVINHQELIERTLKEKPEYIPVPKGLFEALSRARVVADEQATPTTLTIKEGKLRLLTTTHMGVIRDTFTLEPVHPDVAASVSAELVQRSLLQCTKIAIFENCTVYENDDGSLFQIISNVE